MKLARRIALAALACCVLAAAAAVAVRHAQGSSHPPFSRLSNVGRRVTPSTGTMSAFRVDSARLLAVRDGRAFYALETADGHCYGVGSASRTGDVGGEMCGGDRPFPSPFRPILDFSVYEGEPGSGPDQLTIVRIEGFAADGVAAVGVLNRAGKVALRVPVAENVYAFDRLPPGLTGTVVPLDANGTPIGTG